MLKKRLWLMDNLTYNQFKSYRQQRYRAIGLKEDVNDQVLTKFYTYAIVHFLRKRRISKAEPFKMEKLVHTAVCLFRRFYLVNEYGDNFQAQNALCTIYLSLKINQYSHDDIRQLAQSWKTKKEQIFFIEDCLHFGQDGYSEKQLHFLRGIGFQLGRSPIVTCIQSLANIFCQQYCGIHGQILTQVQDLIFQYLRRVYVDEKALFLFQGPKIALAVFLNAINLKQQQYKQSLQIDRMLSEELKAVIERNRMQINDIVLYISKLQKFEQTKIKEEYLQVKSKLIKTKKKRYELPDKKSPKITPLSSDLNEQIEY